MEKKGLIETHNPYRVGGSSRNPYKCDGEVSNRHILYEHKPALTSLNRPLTLTESQKKFKKKLKSVLANKKSGKKRTKIFIRDENALSKCMDND